MRKNEGAEFLPGIVDGERVTFAKLSKNGDSERSVLMKVKVALATAGGVHVMRNSGGFDTKHGIPYGLGRGSSDIVCIVAPYGRWLCVETKRPKGGRVSADQERWLAMVRRYGAVSGVAKSVEEAMALLEEARRPPEWCR